MSNLDLSEIIKLLNNIFDIVKKSESEKIKNEWKKDLPRLCKAIEIGDISIISSIIAKYYSML